MTVLWRSKHSHDRCKVRSKTILKVNSHVWTRQQKRDGLTEHVKVKTLAFKNCNVACRFSIADFQTIYYLEETLFFGVLFVNFHIKDENTRGKQASVTLSYSHRDSEDSERTIYLL